MNGIWGTEERPSVQDLAREQTRENDVRRNWKVEYEGVPVPKAKGKGSSQKSRSPSKGEAGAMREGNTSSREHRNR